MEFLIESDSNIDLRHTVLSHGWVNLTPWDWDDDNGILCRIERLSSRNKTRIEVSQQNSKKLLVRLKYSDDAVPNNSWIKKTVVRWLSADWNPKPAISIAEKISPNVAEFIKKGGGRFLRGTTFYEDFVKTICTMNTSWSYTKKTVARIVESIGDGAFPNPVQILDVGQSFLEKHIRLGYRAKVLINATDVLIKRKLIDKKGNGSKEKISYDKLMEIWGIGPYAAGHLMVLLQDFSKIPIDSEVIKYCNNTYGIESNEITDFFSEWGDYSFLGYKLNRMISQTNWID